MNLFSPRMVALSLTVMLSACSSQFGPTVAIAPDGDAPDHSDEYVEGTVPAAFAEAVAQETVPLQILLAVANAETGLQMYTTTPEFDGQEIRHGIMAIPDAYLQDAADMAGLDVETVQREQSANILAAATLMAEWATEMGIDQTDVAAWAPVVARYSGIEDDHEALAEYVHYEIYRAMDVGIDLEGYQLKGEVYEADWPMPTRALNRTGDSSAIWSPSPNHSSRSGSDPEFVIIHTCEGSYSGCWSWLRNSSAGVSAHYVVNSTGSEVRHLVDEDRKAWHISASYSCSRNSNVDCHRNGAQMNRLSVGIEHAGSGSQSSWHPGLIDRSADLTCGITQRHGITRDRYHIVGHGQLQPWNRSDPGAAWPWTSYLNKVDEACGAGPTPDPDPEPQPQPEPQPNPGNNGGGTNPAPTPGGQAYTIDSNNNYNNSATHYVDVSSSWWPSSNVSGYYNTGYWVASTGSVADAARFRFEGSGCYKVEAWWTSGSDRPTNAAIIGFDEDGEVGRSYVNQRINGSRWNELGHWDFDAGWNNIAISRWTTAGSYVVADAVRVTPSSQCN